MCAFQCAQEHETHIQRTTREQEERIAAMQQEFMTQIARASEGHSRELDELQAEHAQEVGARVCVRRDHHPPQQLWQLCAPRITPSGLCLCDRTVFLGNVPLTIHE